MHVSINSSKINGIISAPPSKSYTHRAIIIASLADGVSIINNPLFADDIKATIAACKALGAKVQRNRNSLRITGTAGIINPHEKVINCHASGTTMRFLTALACLSKKPVVLTGNKRLCERPLSELTTTLSKLGAKIKFLNNQGYPPIKIMGGRINGGEVKLSGEESSQYISALLLIAPYLSRPLILRLSQKLKSRSYIDITLEVMKNFGVRSGREGYKMFRIGRGNYKSLNYKIEGDYTQASYFFAAAAITGGEITIKNLNPKTIQGDKKFLKILQQMINHIFVKSYDSMVRITRVKDHLNPGQITNKIMKFDLADNPDIVQTVAVLSAVKQGKTIITNVSHLRLKETDRIAHTASQLGKMGIKTSITNDSLTILGGNPKGTKINPHDDHRLAMAFAVLALVADGQTVIKNASVVNKSYPEFWNDFRRIGARLKIFQ